MIEKKRVVGPKKDIQEVMNAIKVYDQIDKFSSIAEKSFLSAHQLMMNSLIVEPGKYRKQEVGIVKGKNIEHLAPSAKYVGSLMKELFTYLKNHHDLTLIKSCVFHY